jgi:glycosyltransferase involved in cell wall biosynthesis
MPVYNGERFIAEAVTSVLTSGFADLELLVVDDGSTDASVAEAKRAAAGDPRLRILELQHGGVGAARDAALRAARGELIANMDADDVMLPGRLNRQLEFLDRHRDHVAVGGRVLTIDAEGKPFGVVGRFETHEAIDAQLLAGDGGAMPNPVAMFRRASALEIGGYNLHLQHVGEDYDLWLRLAEVGRIANLPDVLIRYRLHDNNVSTGVGKTARRLPVTLDTLARAFARRGIVDRAPEKLPSESMRRWERWSDRAIVAHYRGDRGRALAFGLMALALNPFAARTRWALRAICSFRSR